MITLKFENEKTITFPNVPKDYFVANPDKYAYDPNLNKIVFVGEYFWILFNGDWVRIEGHQVDWFVSDLDTERMFLGKEIKFGQ